MTNNWSEAANWSTDTVPGLNDTAMFNNTSDKNATIDLSISVGRITINGYRGTINQGADLKVGNFTQAGGAFILNNNLTVESALTITDGTFN